jgi:hypothetical protein
MVWVKIETISFRKMMQRRYPKITILSIILVAIVGFKLIVNSLLEPFVDACESDKIQITLTSRDVVSDPATIVKTLEFMFQNVNEDDPDFVDFVRTLIKPPTNLPINLSQKNRNDFSQLGQSHTIDKALKSKRNGFFVEAGGFNGEDFSNTLFFELQRNWSGLLIEPVVSEYNQLVKKNRNVHSLNACIAGKKPFIGKILLAHVLSGRADSMSNTHKHRIDDETDSAIDKAFLYIPCLPLHTILKAINVTVVDYFSLDIEGGEWDVIRDISFDKIRFNALTVEYLGSPSKNKNSITTKLRENSFSLFKDDSTDLYFVKNDI